MTEHYYTDDERRSQLRRLSDAAAATRRALRNVPLEFAWAIPQLEEISRVATNLIQNGWSREQLRALARDVPKVIWIHKEWTPPLVTTASGHLVEPSWFKALSEPHADLQAAAAELKAIGRY